MEDQKPNVFSILARRRWGKTEETISEEELSATMSQVSRSRMPWSYTGGRPRTVMHSDEGRCTCVECRKARGQYPGSSPAVETEPPEVRPAALLP
mgnify:FL=1